MNQKIDKVRKETEPKRPILKNTFQAFIAGGAVCTIAQIMIEIFQKVFGLEKELSNNISVAVMVFLGALLTGLGVYDKIGQYAGAGTIIPITGFANSMTSSALESKSEGLVQGIITNMFKLAGSVIVTGVVSAFVVGSIVYIFEAVFG